MVRLIEGVQIDTIYHEHLSYRSLATVARIAKAHGLVVQDVDELPTHGGSLRVFLGHDTGRVGHGPAVATLLEAERAGGYRLKPHARVA